MTWEDIPGWLFDFRTIYDEAITNARAGARFVEVGCWQGRTVAYLALEAKRRGKTVSVWAVDNWKGAACDNLDEECRKMAAAGRTLYERFRTNMEDTGAFVHHWEPGTFPDPVSVSAAAAFEPRSCDLIFIDADHSYEAVKADIIAWYPKLRPGGILAGHDSNRGGVQDGIRDALKELNAPGGFDIPVYANYSWIYNPSKTD